MKKKAEIHCFASDCPERLSLCCKAYCRSSGNPERMLGVPAYFCGKCGKEWKALPCNVLERNRRPWEKAFDKKFCHKLSTSKELCLMTSDPEGIKKFIRALVLKEQLELVMKLNHV